MQNLKFFFSKSIEQNSEISFHNSPWTCVIKVCLSGGDTCNIGEIKALWFVPEGAQSAWTLQETHRNSTSFSQDKAQTSEPLNQLS